MGSGIGKKLTKALGALERIDLLESQNNQLLAALNDLNNRMTGQMAAFAELASALVEVVGSEAVGVKITEMREAAATAEAERAKVVLAEGVANGKFVATEEVADNTLIVMTPYKPDGAVLHPGYFQTRFSNLEGETSKLFRGKKVGDTVVLADGSKYEVTGVYAEKQSEAKEQA